MYFQIAVPLSHEYERMDEERSKSGEDSQTLVEFTDEEGYGKYLDLHECFDKYVNLKNVEVRISWTNPLTLVPIGFFLGTLLLSNPTHMKETLC